MLQGRQQLPVINLVEFPAPPHFPSLPALLHCRWTTAARCSACASSAPSAAQVPSWLPTGTVCTAASAPPPSCTSRWVSTGNTSHCGRMLSICMLAQVLAHVADPN
jgi:hypothetical protein